MSKYPRELVVYISIIKMKIINSHAALRLFWRLVNHVNQSNVILVIISPCHMYWSRISLPAPTIKRSVLSVCKICSAFRFCIYLYCDNVNKTDRPNTTPTVRAICTFAVYFSVFRPFLFLAAIWSSLCSWSSMYRCCICQAAECLTFSLIRYELR